MSSSGFPKFRKWENHLNEDPKKLIEESRVLEQKGYKGTQKVVRKINVQSYMRNRLVTKKATDRLTWKPIGV